MTSGEALAVFASGVAVATSIGSLAVALTALIRDRAHLSVETAYAFTTPTFEDYIQVTVINDGRHTEIVSSVGFFTTDKKQMIWMRPESFPNGGLPWQLEPNTSNFAMMPRAVLKQQWSEEPDIGKISKAFARTQSGRVYQDRVGAKLVADICPE